VRQIVGAAPATICIAIVSDPDIAALRRLMTAGARDVLPAPVIYNDLMGSVRQVVAAAAERRQAEQTTRHSGRRGKLIVALAPKGGVGTTTIATNVAVALRQVTAQEVALVDFSLQFGDVGVHLNLRSRYTIQDLVAAPEIDDAMLQRVISTHESGIHVLPAPPEPDAAAHIDGERVNTILDRLLDRYAYVVADTWSFLDEVAETLLRRADEVLLVATPELPTLKNAKRLLEFAMRHDLVPGHIAIVLNRFPSIEGISLDDVQQHLHHTVSANIPSEGQLVTHSINRGVPLVISHQRSWTAQNILRLAARLAGDDVSTIALSAESAKRKERAAGRAPGLWPFARKAT
jgi:pilus assembly protein CpaE